MHGNTPSTHKWRPGMTLRLEVIAVLSVLYTELIPFTAGALPCSGRIPYALAAARTPHRRMLHTTWQQASAPTDTAGTLSAGLCESCTTYTKVGDGAASRAGSTGGGDLGGEIWNIAPLGGGVEACFQAAKSNPACGLYFTYVFADDQNCGCISTGITDVYGRDPGIAHYYLMSAGAMRRTTLRNPRF
jgi:hypothetical protein